MLMGHGTDCLTFWKKMPRGWIQLHYSVSLYSHFRVRGFQRGLQIFNFKYGTICIWSRLHLSPSLAVHCFGDSVFICAKTTKPTPSGSVVQDSFDWQCISLFVESIGKLYRDEKEVKHNENNLQGIAIGN